MFSQTAFRLASGSSLAVHHDRAGHARRAAHVDRCQAPHRRHPDHRPSDRQALARALGRPLLTTSANRPATEEPCRDADEVLEAFAKHIDVVIDTEQTPAEPSTVIEVEGDTVTLIREGQGSIDGILDV